MNEQQQLQQYKKIRFQFIKKCYELNPRMRIQDFERTKGKSESKDLRHYLLHNILNQSKKSHYTLLSHDEILRYPIESEELTEIRFDLDFNKLSKEENIKQNIYLGFKLYNTLKKKGFKSTFYYSGGKGVHCSFLLSTKGLGFESKINNIDLEQYEKEFIKGEGATIDLINKSNNERAKFKKAFYKWFNFDDEVLKWLDFQMCSSKTLLTLEGAKKRNQGAKFKTYLNYDTFSYKQLQSYILNNNNFFIDLKFFSNIATLSQAQIKEIFSFMANDIKEVKREAPKPKVEYRPITKLLNVTDTKAYILTFYNLYKKHNIEQESESANFYSYYISKIVYRDTKNENITREVLEKFFEIIKKETTANRITEKVNTAKKYIDNNPHYISYKYFNIISKEEFIKEYTFNLEVARI